MRGLLVLCAIGAALAAPVDDNDKLLRAKKSYGAGYGAPCAGAAPLAPVALYLSPQGGPIGHYREDEHSDDHHAEHEQARSFYGAPSPVAPVPAYGAGVAAAAAGPAAVGLFPGAKLGGCAVPLLLSCAPSVHSGHLAHQAYGAAAPAYRAQEHDQAKLHEEAKQRESPVAQQWTESARANEHGPIIAPAHLDHDFSAQEFRPNHQ